jgi:pyruvate kinase
LLVTGDAVDGRPGTGAGEGSTPAVISCTSPEALRAVRPGQPVVIDDGKISGVAERADARGVLVRVTAAGPTGHRLKAGKGINLPATRLPLSCLTTEDLELLPFAAAHADAIEMSFVQDPGDVRALREILARLGGQDMGIVLKIETVQAFRALPELILAAMEGPAVGVMIARGDLAVEAGYERLAEVQEEILWLAEAAHVPVIWATEVLDHLAHTGRVTRSEVTDAAMGARAECVMLNKGRHILDAIRVLDGILVRMQDHMAKKSSLLRPLTAWAPAGADAGP